MTPTHRSHARRAGILAVLATAAALAAPTAAGAATATIQGTTLTVTGDDTAETITVGADAGKLTLDGSADLGRGAQLPADGTIDVVVDGAGGDDAITVGLPAGQAHSVGVDGGAGNDVITGSRGADVLRGGDGNDRLIGGPNPAPDKDKLSGGAGNDVLVWNPGDDSDIMDGDAGADVAEINGAKGAENFAASPAGDRVTFARVSPGPFTLDTSVDRLVLNANGGDDTMASDPAVTVPMTLDGGVGADTLTGGGGADLVQGGDENDSLAGGPGADRIVGDRGTDALAGGTGDDALVWNNGDGSDTMDGQDGLDRVEVNGAPVDGDAFTVAPNGARARFDRTNLVPFKLDIGSAEALDVRGQGGADTFTARPGTSALLAVTADGGADDDTLAGAEEADTFFGGTGDDTLTGGAGPDLLDGQDGADTLLSRDGHGDLVRGGAGSDFAQTDALGVDAVDGVERIDAPAATPGGGGTGGAGGGAPGTTDTTATAASVGRTAPVTIRRGIATARLSVSCPAGEPGGCTGTLTLVSAKPVRIGGRRLTVVLGSARYALRPGQRRAVSVRLPTGARGLARKGVIAASAQTVTRDAAGNTAVGSRRVALRLAK